jgi:hypothetical protein
MSDVAIEVSILQLATLCISCVTLGLSIGNLLRMLVTDKKGGKR